MRAWAFHELFDILPLIDPESDLVIVDRLPLTEWTGVRFWEQVFCKRPSPKAVIRRAADLKKWIREVDSVEIYPSTLDGSMPFIEAVARQVPTSLYGSSLDWHTIARAVRWFESKVNAHRWLTREFPDLRPPGTAVLNKSSRVRHPGFNSPRVYKWDISTMGIGSRVIHDVADQIAFLTFVPTEDQRQFLPPEAANRERYLSEPYLEVQLSPSTHAWVGDSNARVMQVADQIVSHLRYCGCRWPSASTQWDNLYAFTMEIGERLKTIGYRGPLNIDWLETSDGDLYVSEINPRFGLTYYPVQFAKRYCPDGIVETIQVSTQVIQSLLTGAYGCDALKDLWYCTDTHTGLVPFGLYRQTRLNQSSPIAVEIFGQDGGDLDRLAKTLDELGLYSRGR